MTNEEFYQLVKDRMTATTNVLISKQKEYSRNDDKLHNFKRAAACQGISNESACVGMWMKHVISIVDLVQDIDKNQHSEMSLWTEKLNDAHNYLYLLEGLINERYGYNG